MMHPLENDTNDSSLSTGDHLADLTVEIISTDRAIELNNGQRWLILGIVLMLCLGGNVLLPWLFWDSRRFGNSFNTQSLAFAAVGGLASQLAILALWCGIGPERLTFRFPIAAFLATMVSTSYILGLHLPDQRPVPGQVIVLLFAVGLAATLVGAALFAGIGRLTGDKMYWRHDDEQIGSRSVFSIGYLIGLTALVAVAVSVVRLVVPTSMRGGIMFDVISVSLVITQHCVFSALLVASLAIMILRSNARWVGAVFLGVLLLVGTPVSLYLMTYYRFFNLNWEITSYFLCYEMGFCASLAMMLLLMRLSGIELRTSGPI